MNPFAFVFDVFGRTRRRDFWLFLVCLFCLYSAMLGAAAGQGPAPVAVLVHWVTNDVGFLLLGLLQIVTVIVAIRRCHDRGLSGWWLFALLVPVLGWLWLFVELGLKPGEREANRYGPSPKAGYRTL